MCYREEIVLLFYVNNCLMFSPYMDKFDCFYASLQVDFKIEYFLELNTYLGIYLDRYPDGSIYLRQHYIT